MAAQPRRASARSKEVKASALAGTTISLMQKTKRLSHDRYHEHSQETPSFIDESLAGYTPWGSRKTLPCFQHLNAVHMSLRSGRRSDLNNILSKPSPPTASTSPISVEARARTRERVFPRDLPVNIQAILQQTLLLSYSCRSLAPSIHIVEFGRVLTG